jgi:hypothetical protein
MAKQKVLAKLIKVLIIILLICLIYLLYKKFINGSIEGFNSQGYTVPDYRIENATLDKSKNVINFINKNDPENMTGFTLILDVPDNLMDNGYVFSTLGPSYDDTNPLESFNSFFIYDNKILKLDNVNIRYTGKRNKNRVTLIVSFSVLPNSFASSTKLTIKNSLLKVEKENNKSDSLTGSDLKFDINITNEGKVIPNLNIDKSIIKPGDSVNLSISFPNGIINPNEITKLFNKSVTFENTIITYGSIEGLEFNKKDTFKYESNNNKFIFRIKIPLNAFPRDYVFQLNNTIFKESSNIYRKPLYFPIFYIGFMPIIEIYQNNTLIKNNNNVYKINKKNPEFKIRFLIPETNNLRNLYCYKGGHSHNGDMVKYNKSEISIKGPNVIEKLTDKNGKKIVFKKKDKCWPGSEYTFKINKSVSKSDITFQNNFMRITSKSTKDDTRNTASLEFNLTFEFK